MTRLMLSNNLRTTSEDERQSPFDFLMQFEALEQLTPEDKKAVHAMIDGLLIRHQAKKFMDA